jgi:hypothetical protein
MKRSDHFDVRITGNPFRRWDMIKVDIHNEGIITEQIVRDDATIATVYRYKPHKNRWIRMIKFWWLKLKVHYS